MASDIARRVTSAGLSRNTTGSAEAGQSTDVDSLEFSSPSLEYRDLPRRFRSGAKASAEIALSSESEPSRGELVFVDKAKTPALIRPQDDRVVQRNEDATIASSVFQLPNPRRSGGRVVQRRIGWLATPDRIVVTTVERELRQTAARQYKPAGDWLIESRKTYREINGKAKKRTGDVREDPRHSSSGTHSAPDADAQAATGIETQVAAEFPVAAQALGALPASVRKSVIARVTVPRFYEGGIIQSSDGYGRPLRNTVQLLRMDSQRTAVVHAVKNHGKSLWSVTLATYELSEPQIEVA